MALSGNTVWEIRTDGNDTNGGGFVTGSSGTDWSQQAAAQYSVTDALSNGTDIISSGSANFGTDVVGNICYLGGAWYQILARPGTTSITVDRAVTTASGLTLKIGGALATPGQAAALFNGQTGNRVFQKAGTYTITTTTANVPGGRVNLTADSYYPHGQWTGYDTNRNIFNEDAAPVIEAGAGLSGFTIFNIAAGQNSVNNIIVDGKSLTSVRGFNSNANQQTHSRIVARNCTNGGLNSGNLNAIYVWCRAESCNIGFDVRQALWCVADGCSGAGFIGDDVNVFNCIARNGGSHGFSFTNVGGIVSHCVADNNAGDGFLMPYQRGRYFNCVATRNGGWGFVLVSGLGSGIVKMQNGAGWSNTSGNINSNITMSDGFITLSADPFVNANAGDYTLNTAAGGGTLLKGTAYPQTLPVV